MNEDVVDPEVQRQAVDRQPSRPARVLGDTGTPVRHACTPFAPAYAANAAGKASV